MNELLLLVPAALAMCVIVYWVAFLPNGEQKVEEPEVVMPTDAELKKMTKGQLETFARDLGVELDKRKTKANMIAEFKSKV
jgi:hypothetical protein